MILKRIENGFQINVPAISTSLVLHEPTPFGRHNWTDTRDSSSSTLLAIVLCSKDEFCCNRGKCISRDKKCDQNPDCGIYDDSDEICQPFESKSNYLDNSESPDSEDFEVKYYFEIFNIAEIATTNEFVIIDANMSFYWNDKRLNFYDLRGTQIISCDKVWNPIVNTKNHQFKVKLEPYIEFCSIYAPNENMTTFRQNKYNDPHMSKY